MKGPPREVVADSLPGPSRKTGRLEGFWGCVALVVPCLADLGSWTRNAAMRPPLCEGGSILRLVPMARNGLNGRRIQASCGARPRPCCCPTVIPCDAFSPRPTSGWEAFAPELHSQRRGETEIWQSPVFLVAGYTLQPCSRGERPTWAKHGGSLARQESENMAYRGSVPRTVSPFRPIPQRAIYPTLVEGPGKSVLIFHMRSF